MSERGTGAYIDPHREGGVPSVVLPCPPDQFREFIAGLLGRPQTIEGSIAGPFEVTKQDAENLYHLIEQRVASQNESTLIQFTARVSYDNHSSVLLNSLQEFLSYNEVKPLTSSALHLSWTYLIKFPTKAFPEKQVIQVTFGSGETRRPAFVPYELFELAVEQWPGGGMTLRIEHTDRTWGTDIEALIRGHLQLLQKPVSKLRWLQIDFPATSGLPHPP
jgi:hypothetical protein